MRFLTRTPTPLTTFATRTAIQIQRSPVNRFNLRWYTSAKVEYHGPSPRVAIIGSGPAGFYTAQKLMREVQGTKVDMYEQLPVPFGLVRFGVAPDHPEVKNCQDTFQDVASSPDYTFIGNVHLGTDFPLRLLSNHYDAIVFAYGASKDRKIGLEGEDNPHIYSARAFVGWYNGLPEYRDLNPDLQAGETAIVVGQGNVALDVARTLLSKTELLSKTDITDHALQALSQSKIKHVHVVGRRGPLQAAFTIKEVRELLHLEDINFTPIPRDLFPPDLTALPRPKRRIMELLIKGSPVKKDATKSWSLDFLLAPKQLEWSILEGGEKSTLSGVTFSRTKLADPDSPRSPVATMDETHTIPTTTLFRSIGYKAEAIPGMEELGASFDESKGTISHDGTGRIGPITSNSSSSSSETSPPSPRLYCSGWVKRGPTGVIASTMSDAFQTAEAIVEDWKSAAASPTPSATTSPKRLGWEGVLQDAKTLNLTPRPVYWDNWRQIDDVEKKTGHIKGKPREKFTHVQDMLEASGK
ncbi:hypothetical protein PV10_01652 [Exophiala mesophila]|uniref:NADPH:adrenodoxin oxidoreductase, mitochondrial n=1 Tax=Exophiala mesophila TaxID=212818 RepID=A0A0D1ZTT3_EXOME|nr:uncharacterized protein PV10_01652 [Exophiala mesophila]KIV97957.1 hypothetical protein PV10_01652 [Exophiala mesophila]